MKKKGKPANMKMGKHFEQGQPRRRKLWSISLKCISDQGITKSTTLDTHQLDKHIRRLIVFSVGDNVEKQ